MSAVNGPRSIFPQLSGGRRGLGREQVARHQRQRLMGATLDACAGHGWPETTVQELVSLAGVSKSTFYEHFSSRDECFLATFDEVVAVASAQIGEAYRSQQGLRERLRAALEKFVEIVLEQPGAARLVASTRSASGQPRCRTAKRRRPASRRCSARASTRREPRERSPT